MVREIRSQLNDALFPALMIERFDLPEDTHPQVLRDVLNELSKQRDFKKLPEEKQGKVIRKLLENL